MADSSGQQPIKSQTQKMRLSLLQGYYWLLQGYPLIFFHQKRANVINNDLIQGICKKTISSAKKFES
jgi:hypothetical protein